MTQDLEKKVRMWRLLVYMQPTGNNDIWRSVAHLDGALVKEAASEHLIVQHDERKRWYALTKKGFEALCSGHYESHVKAERLAFAG